MTTCAEARAAGLQSQSTEACAERPAVKCTTRYSGAMTPSLLGVSRAVTPGPARVCLDISMTLGPSRLAGALRLDRARAGCRREACRLLRDYGQSSAMYLDAVGLDKLRRASRPRPVDVEQGDARRYQPIVAGDVVAPQSELHLHSALERDPTARVRLGFLDRQGSLGVHAVLLVPAPQESAFGVVRHIRRLLLGESDGAPGPVDRFHLQ